MAKVSYVDIPVEVQADYWRHLTPQDRYFYSRVAKKVELMSRKRKQGVTQRSLLPQIADLWNALSGAEREAWSAAAVYSGLNGWRLFVKDTSARIINDMSGSATPDTMHQAWVGQLHIEEPADEIKIAQYHPAYYYVLRKKPKTKGQYEPVKILETLALPLTISLSFKNELESVGEGSYAKFFVNVWSLYQGRDILTEFEIDLNTETFTYYGEREFGVSEYGASAAGSGGWQQASRSITGVVGRAVRYDMFIHIYKMRGDFFCDNIKAEHSGQNWTRDTYCDDINQGFTRAFYQVPKHWTGIVVPTGAWFESVYLDF